MITQPYYLMVAPDSWLESQKTNLRQRIAIMQDELDDVLSAQRTKCRLQQKNLVVATNGKTLVVKPLPDAVHDAAINSPANLRIWQSDGYDIQTALTMRTNNAI